MNIYLKKHIKVPLIWARYINIYNKKNVKNVKNVKNRDIKINRNERISR